MVNVYRPAGSSSLSAPYAAITSQLDRLLRPTVQRTDTWRVAGLQVLTCIYVALAGVYLAVLLYRRSNRPRRLSLRQEKITTTRLVFPLLAIGSGACLLSAQLLATPRSDERTAAAHGLRVLSIVPVFLQGWSALIFALRKLDVARAGSQPEALSTCLRAKRWPLVLPAAVLSCGTVVAGSCAVAASARLFAAINNSRAVIKSTSNDAALTPLLTTLASPIEVMRGHAQALQAALLASVAFAALMALGVLTLSIYGFHRCRPLLASVALPENLPDLPYSPPISLDDVDLFNTDDSSVKEAEKVSRVVMLEEEQEVLREAKAQLCMVSIFTTLVALFFLPAFAFSLRRLARGRILVSPGYAFPVPSFVAFYIHALLLIALFSLLIRETLSSDIPDPDTSLSLRCLDKAQDILEKVNPSRWLRRHWRTRLSPKCL